MTTTTVNAERLTHLLEWATAEDAKERAGKRSEWDQGIWSNACGTACCIAGKVALEDGLTPAPAWPGASVYGKFLEDDGTSHDASDYASAVLGLTEDQAYRLFESGNDLTNVRMIIERLIAGESLNCDDPECYGTCGVCV